MAIAGAGGVYIGRSLKMKLLKPLLLPLLLTAALAGGGYAWYLQSPLFALNEIGQAMATHDKARFDRYVDRKALVRHAVADYAETRRGLKKATIRAVRWPVSVWLKIQLGRMVTRIPSEPPPQFAYIRWYWQTGNGAHVQVVLRERSGKEIPVALRLEKTDAWRVVQLENLPELLERSSKDGSI